MIQQEIQECNKQIATMLGWKEEQPGSWFRVTDSVNYVVYSEHNNYPHRGLPFHRDWNWLHEAVEFIEEKLKLETVISNMGFGVNNQYMNINRGVSIVNQTLDNPSKIMGKASTKKEAVFTAVSDFAKIFNDKKL
jgi:hypothetical protein